MRQVKTGWAQAWAVLTLLAVLVGCSGSGSGASAAAPARPTTKAAAPLHLVAIGDSIPYNSPDDCPNCVGFVERYAKALQAASGRPVVIQNLSQHNGLTLPMLLDELADFQVPLTAADAIVIGIAHNSMELNQDKPCGGSLDADDIPDWSKLDRGCAVA
jgi:hypothetical protein